MFWRDFSPRNMVYSARDRRPPTSSFRPCQRPCDDPRAARDAGARAVGDCGAERGEGHAAGDRTPETAAGQGAARTVWTILGTRQAPFEQLELAIEDLEETQAEEEAKAEIAAPAATKEKRTRMPRGPRKLPDDLPVERVVEPAPCACGKCGGLRLRKLGEVVSKTLECEPRRWKFIEHVREKFACRDCEAITEPPAPSHPIPRGFAGPSLLAMILVGKFLVHQPLNRQSAAYAREGVDIDPSTLADRVGACVVALAPIVSRLREHVLAANASMPTTRPCRSWRRRRPRPAEYGLMSATIGPFGGKDPPAAFFEYSRPRRRISAKALRRLGRLMQADAFAGYNELYDGARKPGPMIEMACWAHCAAQILRSGETGQGADRGEAVRRIDEFFAIERTINGKSPDEREPCDRNARSPWSRRWESFCAKSARFSPQERPAKAINYGLNRGTLHALPR